MKARFLLFLFASALHAQVPLTRDVAGRVTGGKDQIAGARVTVWRNDMNRATVEPQCDGKTDAEGKFAFKAVPWVKGHDWGFNTMVVVARAASAVGVINVRGDEADPQAIAIALGPAVDVSGVVRGNDGEPIAGAAVWPWLFGAMDGTGSSVTVTAPLVPWHVRTGADGRFTLKGMPALSCMLRVQHDGHAEARVTVVDPGKACEVLLGPGACISGVVRMPDGKPAARVMVAAQGQKESWYGRVQTDEQGRYALRTLPPDLYNVWAEAEDLTVVALDSVVGKPGEPMADQDLQLVKGGFITGRVVDAATGKVVQPGATADVAMYGPARPRSGGGCQVEPVLLDGTYRIRAPAGVNFIYLRPGAGWVEVSEGENVTVVEGEETKVDFKAKQGRERR